ncbi:hypothetical protein C0584_02615 [Candidatus Parcubacteria bacterium]|nr:MAG: hypothetical protein C0584_02615 [Candidatus Parcubacteria bacterium]
MEKSTKIGLAIVGAIGAFHFARKNASALKITILALGLIIFLPLFYKLPLHYFQFADIAHNNGRINIVIFFCLAVSIYLPPILCVSYVIKEGIGALSQEDLSKKTVSLLGDYAFLYVLGVVGIVIVGLFLTGSSDFILSSNGSEYQYESGELNYITFIFYSVMQIVQCILLLKLFMKVVGKNESNNLQTLE